jgi:hypothetical protein
LPVPGIEWRIKWAGLLIAAGLIVQLLTLIGTHPLSFVAFLCLGCPLVVGGILLYLFSLVSHTHRDLKPDKQL